MKSLTEYILEKADTTAEVKTEVVEEEKVWVVKDKDLDGAILDVCTTEEDAQKAYEEHMKENEDSHLEVVPMDRSEVEKNEE